MRRLMLMTLLCAACAGGNANTKPASNKTLYDRLGGKPAIVAVVDLFVDKVGKDERINARFANTDIPHFKGMLVEQICEASGGPCKYTGKDMKTSHAGMKITSDEFTALVEDLKFALDQAKAPADAETDLINALAPMKPDIVGQ